MAGQYKNVKRITVTLFEDQVDALQDVAEDLNGNLSEAVREAVSTYLMEHYWGNTIGDVARRALIDGATNQEALDAVKERYPNAATSLSSIAWYRAKLRKAGEDVLTDREIRQVRGEAG